MASEPPKAFGPWHDFILLVAGFLLTTLLGTYITMKWKRAASEADTRATLIETQREQATAVFEDVSHLLDRRLFRWRQLLWAVERGDSSTVINRERQAYRTVTEEWNYSLNRNQAMLCRYFGNSNGTQFLQAANQFRTLHAGITEQLRAPRPDSSAIADMEAAADKLNTEIFHFNNALVERIRLGTVGISVPADSINARCGSPVGTAKID